jgi:hypothetical protein
MGVGVPFMDDHRTISHVVYVMGQVKMIISFWG